MQAAARGSESFRRVGARGRTLPV